MFLGEVLSIFRLFWWPLSSCIVLVCFVGLWPFGNKFLLIQKKGMRGVGLIVPNPRTHYLNLLAKVTVEVEGCD